MTEGRAIYLRVGLLLLGGVVLVLVLIWFFGGTELSHGTLYESYFSESVQGLDVGSPVKYRGVTVGRVTQLGLVSAEYGDQAPANALDQRTFQEVFVRFVVDRTRIGWAPDTGTLVKEGLRVRLAAQGITGLTYLELDFVSPENYPAQHIAWTPRDEVIPSMPSTLQQVQHAATQFLAKMNRVDIDALSQSLTGLVADVRTSLDTGDLHQTLAHTATLMRTLNDTVRAADLPGLTADLRQTSDSLRTLAQDRDLHRALANAAVATDRLAAASAKLAPLIAALQATAQRADAGTADLQQGLLPILRDAQAAAANLRDVTDAMRRYPAQVLLSAPPPRAQEPAK